MKTQTVRIPESTYEAVRTRAEADRRSIANMVDVLLVTALAGDVRLEVAEPWPQPPDPVRPVTAAEKEFATGDPLEAAPLQPGAVDDAWPEPEPEPEPVFVPVEDHFKPDFKGKKK